MLKINMEYRRGILFLRLRGNLNANTVSKFEEYTLPILKNYGIKYVVYNLNELKSIDKSGIESINKSKKLIANNKGKVLLVNNHNNDNQFDLHKISNELVALDLLTT